MLLRFAVSAGGVYLLAGGTNLPLITRLPLLGVNY